MFDMNLALIIDYSIYLLAKEDVEGGARVLKYQALK